MQILLVGDNRTTARIIEITLGKQGYDVVWASTGTEGIERLMQNPGVRLVITDLMMPGMSGFAFLRRLQALAGFKDMPVIMCTAASRADQVRKAAAMGCRHYLVKPVDPAALTARVREVLSREPVSLRPRDEVVSRYGLTGADYDQMAQAFADTLRSQLAALTATKGHGSDANPDSKPDLAGLWEGAALLGADRLVTILSSAGTEASGRDQTLRDVLAAEIRELLTMLSPAGTGDAAPGPAIPDLASGAAPGPDPAQPSAPQS